APGGHATPEALRLAGHLGDILPRMLKEEVEPVERVPQRGHQGPRLVRLRHTLSLLSCAGLPAVLACRRSTSACHRTAVVTQGVPQIPHVTATSAPLLDGVGLYAWPRGCRQQGLGGTAGSSPPHAAHTPIPPPH